jgi:anti-sigma factor RsiW
MTCPATSNLQRALIDREFDAAGASEVEAHVASCPRCSALLNDYRGMRDALSNPGMRYRAPDSLRARIEASLPAARALAPRRRSVSKGFTIANVVSAALSAAVAAGVPSWRTLFSGFAFGSAVSAAAALLMITVIRSDPDQVIVSDVVSAHLRSLQANHLTDVQADQHGVGAWFSDRLGSAPPIPDLAAQGFNLTGARIDYVLGKAVAALVYERDNHVVNVFIAQRGDETGRSTKLASLQGINVELWSEKGLDLCAVGDLSAKELQDIRKKFEAAT